MGGVDAKTDFIKKWKAKVAATKPHSVKPAKAESAKLVGLAKMVVDMTTDPSAPKRQQRAPPKPKPVSHTIAPLFSQHSKRI